MNLTPAEQERLNVFMAAQLAREHRSRGIKLSHPEAIAYICDELIMGARQGRSLKDLMGYGAEILTTDDVMAGVADMIPVLHVEAIFEDGSKLITVHQPIRPGKEKIKPGPRAGEIITPKGEIELNAGRRTAKVTVTNSGDRPVQIGSHFHFFEINRGLEFDREKAFGMRLDIPSGTAVRFEPGQKKEVSLCEIGGRGRVTGFNSLTEGMIESPEVKEQAIARAKERGFRGA
jgi:urease subunit gamma/beta